MTWAISIWRWFLGLFGGSRDGQKSEAYRTLMVTDTLPQSITPNTLYVVQEDGFLEQAAMQCPCGCKRILHMNLLPDERPCWKLTRHSDGTATLFPSVWRKKDCGSHFWFRKGQVFWCND
jgi:hypothetical protein